MRNVSKILCSLIVLSGFVLAALSCKSSSNALEKELMRSTNGSSSDSGKEGASLVPSLFGADSIQVDDKHVRPEAL